ncbi:MAG: hypothetical protein ABIQ52_09845 [Vicinamibacterales bacterium]
MNDPAKNPPAGDGAYAAGIEMMDRGEPPAAVEKKLVEMGLTAEAAQGIIASYSGATAQAASSDGKIQIWGGAAALGLGIVGVATGSVTSWFAVLVGGANVFLGWKKGKKPD